MSWTPETVIIRGFKIPRDIWNEGINKCEETNCLEDWEDYFIDMDPVSGKGDTFFGEIVTTISKRGLLKVIMRLIPIFLGKNFLG